MPPIIGIGKRGYLVFLCRISIFVDCHGWGDIAKNGENKGMDWRVVEIDAKAMNTLVYALSPKEFNRVSAARLPKKYGTSWRLHTNE